MSKTDLQEGFLWIFIRVFSDINGERNEAQHIICIQIKEMSTK